MFYLQERYKAIKTIRNSVKTWEKEIKFERLNKWQYAILFANKGKMTVSFLGYSDLTQLDLNGYEVQNITAPYIYDDKDEPLLCGKIIHWVSFYNAHIKDQFVIYFVNVTLNDNIIIIDQV